jgi:hypothetical protein
MVPVSLDRSSILDRPRRFHWLLFTANHSYRRDWTLTMYTVHSIVVTILFVFRYSSLLCFIYFGIFPNIRQTFRNRHIYLSSQQSLRESCFLSNNCLPSFYFTRSMLDMWAVYLTLIMFISMTIVFFILWHFCVYLVVNVLIIFEFVSLIDSIRTLSEYMKFICTNFRNRKNNATSYKCHWNVNCLIIYMYWLECTISK